MRRFALLFVPVALLLGILIAAACSSKEPTVTTHNDASAPTGAKAADVIRASVQKTQAANSVSAEYSLTIRGMKLLGDTTITGTAQSDFTNHQAAADVKALGMEIQTVLDNNTAYAKSALFGDGWYKLESTELNKITSAGTPLGNAVADPAQAFTYLKSVSDSVQTVGSEQVRGVAATHYKAQVDLAKAAQDAGASAQGIDKLGVTSLPVDVWVDGEGRIARLAFDLSLTNSQAGASSVSFTGDFFDYGKPVTVAIPPADQVHDLNTADLGGLFGSNKKQP